MIAICKIKTEPTYRRNAFEAGLRAVGYDLVETGCPKDKRDLLVIWNRQQGEEGMADTWERSGGSVLVCENGYMGRDELDRQLYAIAIHGHNGSGWFPQGDDDRLTSLNIQMRPWVSQAGHILICAQRGIGSREMASPHGWHDRTKVQLRAMGFKDVRVRLHPGRFKAETTLEQDLAGAAACVVWSSSSGVRSMALGVPTVYCAPHWILEIGGGRGLGAMSALPRDDGLRLAAFQRMAHAQWRVQEIESGEPFARMLAGIEGASW